MFLSNDVYVHKKNTPEMEAAGKTETSRMKTLTLVPSSMMQV